MASHKRRVPFVEQMEQSECGLCCLAMVLGYYRSHVPLSELRERSGGGRDGTTLLALRNLAQSLGLDSRGQRLPADQLANIEGPAILHWQGTHYVVLEKIVKGKAHLLDPAVGRITMEMAELQAQYSGVAMLFTPTPRLVPRRKESLWGHYLKLLFAEPWLFASIIAWSLWIQLLALVAPVLTQYLIDQVMMAKELAMMKTVGVGMICLLLFQILFSFLRAQYLVRLQNALDWHLMSRFFGHLLRLPYHFFQLRSTGDLILRANSNLIVREILSNRTVTAMLDGGLVVFFLIFMLSKSLLMTGLVVSIGCGQVLLLVLSNAKIKRLSQEEILRQTRATSYVTEVLHGMTVIKAEGMEQSTYERWSGLFQEQLLAARRRGMLSAHIDTWVGALRYAAPLILLYVGSYQVVNGGMSVGQMFGFYSLALAFLTPLSSLATTISQMAIIGAYLNRILDIHSAAPEQDEQAVVPPPVLKGGIELRNVSFRYHAYAPDVVRGVDVRIEPGQKVALVGASGSGKSTLANLLLGLYLPTEGEIFYDGNNLSVLDKPALRRQIGVVMQDAFLFNRSIAQNIALHEPDMPPERIQQAARLAVIDEEIQAMPMKYGTNLSENGSNISGGQRQRLALARALAHEPAILLLDEATSALDPVTEARVDENLSALSCTRVVVAHRLSTVINADLILMLDKGEIVERGTHEELLRLQGRYAEFYQAKSRDEVQT